MSQPSSQNNWTGEIFSQDLDTQGVDPLAFFATNALEAASQIDFDPVNWFSSTKKRKRDKKSNNARVDNKHSSSKRKNKSQSSSPTKSKDRAIGSTTPSKLSNFPLFLAEGQPDKTSFVMDGNTTSLFRNPIHTGIENASEDDTINSGSNGTALSNRTNTNHELPMELRTSNNNFKSVADGIDLRARHIHKLPISNKAMPRKRENQRYLLGLGYLSREFYSYLLSRKDGRGDIIDFANLQKVSRRRVYDIVCAMEGGGICYAEKKHVVGWKPTSEDEKIEDARKCFKLRNEIKDLKQEEVLLDVGIQRMESLIRNLYSRQGKLHYIVPKQLQRAIRNTLVDDECNSAGVLDDGKKRSILLINTHPSQLIQKVTDEKDKVYQLHFCNIKYPAKQKSSLNLQEDVETGKKCDEPESLSRHLRVFEVSFKANKDGITALRDKKKKMGITATSLDLVDTYNYNDSYDDSITDFVIKKSDLYDSTVISKRRQVNSSRKIPKARILSSSKRSRTQHEKSAGGGIVIKKRLYRRSRSKKKKCDSPIIYKNEDKNELLIQEDTSISRTKSLKLFNNAALSRSTSLSLFMSDIGQINSTAPSQNDPIINYGDSLSSPYLHSQSQEDVDSSQQEKKQPAQTLSQKILLEEVGNEATTSGVTLVNSVDMILQLSQDNNNSTTSLPILTDKNGRPIRYNRN
jgi:hypothetical protein